MAPSSRVHARSRSLSTVTYVLKTEAPATPIADKTRGIKDRLDRFNHFSNGQKESWEFHNDGNGYHIPDVTFRAAENRRLRVITIGSGVSGILATYKIDQGCENIEHVVYEKNSDLGGTWLVNRYPRCGCDVPSPDYAFNFALNPDWDKYFSGSAEICEYLHQVVEKLDLAKYIRFRHEVVGCYFDKERGRWDVEIRKYRPDGSFETIYDCADFVIYATGLFNKWNYPEIRGLKDFKGRVIHTAGWPADYTEKEWKKDRIGVIGGGSSAIQVVPGLQPKAKKIDVFVRSPSWFLEFKGLRSPDFSYSKEEKDFLRENPRALVDHVREVDCHINKFFHLNFRYSEAQKQARAAAANHAKALIKDKRLLQGFKPNFSVGCRRLTPGDPFMNAIQENNVDVHFTGVSEVTTKGLVGTDGVLREVDTIVCATGYITDYKPAFPVVGLRGVDLRHKWRNSAEGYLGVGVDGFPNFLMFMGPNWPINSSSAIQNLIPLADYCVQIINKVQAENIRYLSPKPDVTRAWNMHAQAWFKGTVWDEDCSTWFRDRRTGKINALWPGSNLHYMEMMKTPRYEDFDICYSGRNQWAFMGLGYTKANRDTSGKEDLAPTLHVENLDPRFYM